MPSLSSPPGRSLEPYRVPGKVSTPAAKIKSYFHIVKLSSTFLRWMHFFFQAVWGLGKELLPLAEGLKWLNAILLFMINNNFKPLTALSFLWIARSCAWDAASPLWTSKLQIFCLSELFSIRPMLWCSFNYFVFINKADK